MDTASQWGINRWPTPPAFKPDSGDSNIVTNAQNNVVLGMWGYYGDNGSHANPSDRTIPQIGDSTSYRITLDFGSPRVRPRISNQRHQRPHQAGRFQ